MLALAGNARIFLCREAIDMRKGFEGLSGLVESLFSGELTSGAYFVFLNWNRNRMKVMCWDVDGYFYSHNKGFSLKFATVLKGNRCLTEEQFILWTYRSQACHLLCHLLNRGLKGAALSQSIGELTQLKSNLIEHDAYVRDYNASNFFLQRNVYRLTFAFMNTIS